MAKKKTKVKTNKVSIKQCRGMEINGVIYYMDDFDYDFIRGLMLMSEVMSKDGNK